MNQSKRRKRAGPLAGVLAVAIVTWTFADSARAQDKGQPAQVKPAKAQPKSAGAQAGTAKPSQAGNQSGPRMGPPKPPVRIQRGQPGVRRIQPRKAQNTLPKPTVVLKPGEVPAIKFDEPVWDFGRVRAGSDIVHEFWFTNTGNGPLEILRVKPS